VRACVRVCMVWKYN